MVVEAHMRGLMANVAGLLCLLGGESLLGVKKDTFGSLVAPFD